MRVRQKRTIKTHEILKRIASTAGINSDQVKIVIQEMANITLENILNEEGGAVLFQHFVKIESRIKRPFKKKTMLNGIEMKARPKSIRFRCVPLGQTKKKFDEYVKKLEEKNSKNNK